MNTGNSLSMRSCLDTMPITIGPYPVYSASQLRHKAMRKLKVPAVPADTKTAGTGEVQYSPLDALKNRTISACE